MMLFAHPGHWAAQLLYLAPVAAMVGAILWAKYKGRGLDPDDDGPNDNQEQVSSARERECHRADDGPEVTPGRRARHV
jgi:hypothetical protein